jgi:protein-S-isoprenylcysteine O-methyltransferase Ste14
MIKASKIVLVVFIVKGNYISKMEQQEEKDLREELRKRYEGQRNEEVCRKNKRKKREIIIRQL